MSDALTTTKKRPPIPAIYAELAGAVERRIRALGLTLERVDELAGVPERYTAKALRPETPSGRVARWETIDCILGAVFPGGIRITVSPRNPELPDRLKVRTIALHPPSKPRRMDVLEAARLGGLASGRARRSRLPPERLAEIERRAERRRQGRARRQSAQQPANVPSS